MRQVFYLLDEAGVLGVAGRLLRLVVLVLLSCLSTVSSEIASSMLCGDCVDD